MNLTLQLLLRILIIACISVVASAAYVLYQTDHQAILQAEQTAERINQQMSAQMLKSFTRYDYRATFPNTDMWNEINGLPGSCIQFLSRTESRRRNICSEINESERSWPKWFDTTYSRFFQPDYEAQRPFSFNALTYGKILVTLNKQAEISRAWHNLQAVIGVLSVSILAVSVLVFLTIKRMLKPAQIIVSGLEKMQQGQLSNRLPSFDVMEWRRTSEAINALVASQQQILAENKQLTLKLMNVQEEEQRYIARELHDEFGQCLAGINAITSSIRQTAQTQCPEMQQEADNIRNITEHMMSALHSMLTRLRPTEVDEVGLHRSLKKLLQSWNQRSGDTTEYQLKVEGNIDDLPDPLPVNLYRIVQESLTNIAKHTAASMAWVTLKLNTDKSLHLIIEDNGQMDNSASRPQMGMGLLGIHERVKALGGEILLTTNPQGGMKIMITMFTAQATETLL